MTFDIWGLHSVNFYNRVLYNKLASLYGALDWLTLGMWWWLVSRALEYVPAGRRVLEVGFGPGKLHVELARRPGITIGLDLAIGMCRLTQRRLERAGMIGRITRGDMLMLPYPDRTFDAVVSTFTLPGIPDGAQALREMARVTGIGGRVVLVDIGLPGDGNWVGIFWARLWERMGMILYDQVTLMRQAGLMVSVYQEFGPGRHIRVVVGEKA